MTKTELLLDSVRLEFPIYQGKGKSLTSSLLGSAIGGRLRENTSGRVVVDALPEISIKLNDGARLGVLGPNGSGKTSLLRLMAGIYEPTSGSIRRRGVIGSLIDIGLGINPDATGLENIELRSAIMGVSKARLRKVHDDIVEFAEIGDFLKLPVKTYSTGMQMRLAFAVATSVQPDILLMDEWLSVGDASFQARAEQRLSSIVANANILVMASHSRDLIEKVTTTAIILSKETSVLEEPVSTACTRYFLA
ncbi:ATP-binding cassette domain-containing protein [Aquiluna sp.]|nr:ATP-binding cassette domain-containing protein [Aquiluna sp.]